MKFDKSFEKIEMIISDFDGVFTDCRGTIDENGHVSKTIHYQDVLGIALAITGGLKVAIITGEEAGAVKYLAGKFEQLRVFQDIKDKLPVVKNLLAEYGIKPENVLYIGDDINDFQVLQYVGTKITVPNANERIKNIPDIKVTDKSGGDGVFRELVDAVLERKLNNYFAEEVK